MKRVYITLAVIMLFAWLPPVANAQHFGVKAGINFSDPKAEVKTNMGYQAGIAVQCDLPLWFSIQPELLFHLKGGQVSAGSGGNTRPFGLGYLEIPVNIQWGPRFSDDRFRIFVQGSPFIGYAISKDVKNSRGESYGWKNINRFEYGVGAGLGIQLWRHFQITGQYNWSLGDLVASGFAEDEFKRIFNESNFSGYTVSLAIIF